MSEEYEVETTENYSSFWPLLVLLIGLTGWLGYQDYALNAQRSLLKQSLEAAGPTFNAAQNWQARYATLMKDLVETGSKDPAAAQISKEAIQAGIQVGLIRVNNQTPAAGASTNAAANPAAPTK